MLFELKTTEDVWQRVKIAKKDSLSLRVGEGPVRCVRVFSLSASILMATYYGQKIKNAFQGCSFLVNQSAWFFAETQFSVDQLYYCTRYRDNYTSRWKCSTKMPIYNINITWRFMVLAVWSFLLHWGIGFRVMTGLRTGLRDRDVSFWVRLQEIEWTSVKYI